MRKRLIVGLQERIPKQGLLIPSSAIHAELQRFLEGFLEACVHQQKEANLEADGYLQISLQDLETCGLLNMECEQLLKGMSGLYESTPARFSPEIKCMRYFDVTYV